MAMPFAEIFSTGAAAESLSRPAVHDPEGRLGVAGVADPTALVGIDGGFSASAEVPQILVGQLGGEGAAQLPEAFTRLAADDAGQHLGPVAGRQRDAEQRRPARTTPPRED